MSEELEEGFDATIDFGKLQKAASKKKGVVPVVVQECFSGEVLMVGYANLEAVLYSLKNGRATFWSTSRNELWVKGLKSGNTLLMKEVRVNCEQNALLYIVYKDKGGACHTKNEHGQSRSSCFYRRLDGNDLKRLKLVGK